MKKFVTFLTTGLLALMCCATVVLAESNPDVYYTEERSADTTYKVSVMTNGKATDGVIDITYNTAALTCDASDVAVSANVDLHSVNVENGMIKIAYVAEKEIPAGNIVTVTFDVTEAYADQEVSATVNSVSHDAKGNTLTAGPEVKPVEPETPVVPETPVEPETPSDNGGSGYWSDNEPEETEKPAEDKKPADNKKPEEGKDEPGRHEDKKKVEVKVDLNKEDAWKDVVAELKNVKEDEILTISFESVAEVAKEFLEAVKEQQKEVLFELENGIKWTIDGTTITDNVVAIKLDVEIGGGEIPETVVENIAHEKEVVKLSLAHEGDFGCQLVMILPVGAEHEGNYANLYYYNPATGELEFIASAKIDADGNALLNFGHASDYVVVLDTVAQDGSVVEEVETEQAEGTQQTEQPETPVQADGAEQTSSVPVAAIVLVIIVIAAVVVVFVVKKKKAE